MEVPTAVSVPRVLKVAYDALLFSWNQYEKVEGNQTQCLLLIQRCQDLFFEDVHYREDDDWTSGRQRVRWETFDTRQDQGGACCCRNRNRRCVDNIQLRDAPECTNLQVEIASARKADQEELIARLDSLVYNDRKILSALQDDARRQRRLGELIVAFTKVGCAMYG